MGWKSRKSGPGSATTRRVMCLPHGESLLEQGFSSTTILAVVMACVIDFNSHGPRKKDKKRLPVESFSGTAKFEFRLEGEGGI